MIDWDNMKEDNRPKKNFWAPGNYTGKCVDCGCWFLGDKRAQQCADCAYDKDVEPTKQIEDMDFVIERTVAEAAPRVIKTSPWKGIDVDKIKTFEDIIAILGILEITITTDHEKFSSVEHLVKDE